jgi:hypothetical protein
MAVYQIDPLGDRRWDEFLETHPRATIFHTPGWLKCLQVTYGYQPFALTTSQPGSQLTNGIVFCRVKSWLTGERIVSVPFADHCQPLFERAEDLLAILEWARQSLGQKSSKPIEIRPLEDVGVGFAEYGFQIYKTFRFHLLDLRPSLEELLQSCDKDSVQRRLRRAERENLAYEEGNSLSLVRKFYQLQVLTRRKHQVPPQPFAWFQNLIACLGERVRIRVASKSETPLASILTLSHKRTVVYKYGCSNATYNSLAGTPYLFWRAIQDAKQQGAYTFDMGRSDLDNPGLIKFKSHWGALDFPLTYWRCPQSRKNENFAPSRSQKWGGYVLSRLPDNLLILLGRVLYKHIG